jgi:hypothetical protein
MAAIGFNALPSVFVSQADDARVRTVWQLNFNDRQG